MGARRRLAPWIVAALSFALVGTAVAHWCSNIFTARARLVVKPEKTTVILSGTPTPLRVYLQNNFPYRIDGYMRATVSGSTINPTPTHQYVYPGQNVSYVFSLTGSGSTSVSTLNLQVRFRTSSDINSSPWRSESDSIINPNPTQSNLVSASSYSGNQAASLNAAVLGDLYSSATLGTGTAWANRDTGLENIIHHFGYRFCYSSGGAYRCGSSECPTTCSDLDNSSFSDWTSIDQFGQNCMRAGVEVAVRKADLGSQMGYAQNAAVNALKHSSGGGGSAEHKCLAAVIGGYLWQGASSTTTFTSALSASANSVTSICQNAGLRALGQGSSSACTSGQYYERAACAAAEGLANNNGPVTSVLMPNAGDGASSGSYNSLYYAYMLRIVAAYRKDTTGSIPFYPDAGVSSGGCSTAGDCDDSNPCTTDSCAGTVCQNTPISGCCTSAAQCGDSDPCTTDTCVSNACQHAPVSGCCTSAAQCGDSDPCTTDTCSSNVCQHAPVSGCCTTTAQCNDNNVCTTDSCSSNVCQHSTISGCCTAASQCNDSDPCTTDTCSSNVCQHGSISGCCTANSQCNDGNSCTTDTCSSNVCQHAPVSGCCTSNADCADNNVCTTDTCNTTTGICSNVQQTGCCVVDTDCADSDPRTIDTCNTTSHTCSNTAFQCDAGVPLVDSGPGPEAGPSSDLALTVDLGPPLPDQGGVPLTPTNTLEGGCSLGRDRVPAVPLTLLLLVVVALVRRRRR